MQSIILFLHLVTKSKCDALCAMHAASNRFDYFDNLQLVFLGDFMQMTENKHGIRNQCSVFLRKFVSFFFASLVNVVNKFDRYDKSITICTIGKVGLHFSSTIFTSRSMRKLHKARLSPPNPFSIQSECHYLNNVFEFRTRFKISAFT